MSSLEATLPPQQDILLKRKPEQTPGTTTPAFGPVNAPTSPATQPDLSTSTLFAFNSFDYAQIFSDFRVDDDTVLRGLQFLAEEDNPPTHSLSILSIGDPHPHATNIRANPHHNSHNRNHTHTNNHSNHNHHSNHNNHNHTQPQPNHTPPFTTHHSPALHVDSGANQGLSELDLNSHDFGDPHQNGYTLNLQANNPWTPTSTLLDHPRSTSLGSPSIGYSRSYSQQQQQQQQHLSRGSMGGKNHSHPKPLLSPGAQVVVRSPAELVGKVITLCKDQNGCRHLQSLLDEGGNEYVNVIFTEVLVHAPTLMVDPFGNYLCQKLVEKCNDEQRVHFIEAVSSSLVQISLNIHGTRAVQKVIDCVEKSEQIDMVASALGKDVVPLVKDLNGNHVIQRCLQKFGPERCQFIFDAVACHLVDVATHRHGCCVLQRCIDHANKSQRRLLVSEIATHALRLVQDPFGNYVVQYVLDLFPREEQSLIVVQFVGSVAHLSTQKFSSNVMEKCLELADVPVRLQLLEEICRENTIPVLLNDPFGNYVIQRALTVADAAMFDKLCSRIRPHISSLRASPNGKRIYSKLMKKFPVLGIGCSNGPLSSPPQNPLMMHSALLATSPRPSFLHHPRVPQQQQVPQQPPPQPQPQPHPQQQQTTSGPFSPGNEMDSPFAPFPASPHLYDFRAIHHSPLSPLSPLHHHHHLSHSISLPPPMPSLPPSTVHQFAPMVGSAPASLQQLHKHLHQHHQHYPAMSHVLDPQLDFVLESRQDSVDFLPFVSQFGE